MPVTEVTLSANDYKAAVEYLKEFAKLAPNIKILNSKYDTDQKEYKKLRKIIEELEAIAPTTLQGEYIIRRV
jgi:hypothetical protein